MERNVPKLRFKGFSDEWQLSNLDKLCNVNPKNNKLPDKFIYIDLESIIDGVLIKKNIIELKDAPSRAQRLLEYGDVLFQTVRPYQMNNYLFEDSIEELYVASTGYAQLRCKNGISNNKFIYQILHNKKFNNNVMLRCTGTSYPAINSSELVKISFRIPSLQEQERIANFLTKVDKIIEKQDEKVKNLEKYKKGMMQKIFSQEIRFKDENGEDYPEWEEKKLGDVFTVSAGGDISKQNVIKEKNDKFKYPIFSNSLLDRGLYGYSDLYKIEGESITVTGRGSIGVAIARNEKYYPIVRLLVLVPKEMCDIKFFEEVINSTKLFIESTGVPQLTSPQLSNIKIKNPCLQEQRKIGSILLKIDNIVVKEKEKLEKLKKYKKGLLKALFI